MKTQEKSRKLSGEFIQKLAEVSAGYLPPERLDQFIAVLEDTVAGKYFSYPVESNMIRIILAMYDKVSFFNDCIAYPHYPQLLVSVAANSNYLTDILVRNPEYFYWAANPAILQEKVISSDLEEQVKKSLSAYKSFKAKLNALRAFKRKETLRTGCKDIFENAPFGEIVNELSILAKVITSNLFSLCYTEVLNRYWVKDITREYTLIALGKLGGDELNYSSDIDLIIFYDEDAELLSVNNTRLSKTYQEVLIETIYLFIESASSITSSGFMYRVDFRLRPDGRNSALTRTISYYINYYENRGEDWEKQMLIKASFVSGSKRLYDKFMSNLTPFIYPASFAISPTEQIKKLKAGIEKKTGSAENIKLSAGGIRDIEFAVQALQLIFGGKHKSIRTPNTLDAIGKLKEQNLLSENEASQLTDTYIFFRKIEHFLQLMNDKQTHTLPSGGEMLTRLSHYMGFSKIHDFKSTLSHYRKDVSVIYHSVMGSDKKKDKPESIEVKFENKSRAEKDLLFLREGKGILGQRQFDKDTLEAFQAIEGTLFHYLKKSETPDQILQNFARIIRAEDFPSMWYKEFGNKKFFESFLTVCEYSQMAIDLFAEDETLREQFLTRKVFEKPVLKDVSNLSTKKFLYQVLVQFTLNLISSSDVSKYLAEYFSKKTSWLTAEEKIDKQINTGFFVGALGSFGSGDLSFASDLDVIFIADTLPDNIDVQKYFQELFLKLQEDFKPFEIDCRLRAEGKSSWLVWDLKNYENYIFTRARVWELQAFCKLRFIHGDKKLYKKFIDLVKKKIGTLDKDKTAKEITDMRKKLYPQASSIIKNINLKKSKGGITDIEFLIQQIMLLNPEAYASLAGLNTITTLNSLISQESKYEEFEPLKENFVFLKNLELVNQNIFNVLNTLLPSDETKLRKISSFTGFNSSAKLMEQVLKTLKSNQIIFDKFTGNKN